MRRLSLLLIVILTPALLVTEARADSGIWLAWMLRAPVSRSVGLSMDVHHRRGDHGTVSIIRPHIDLRLSGGTLLNLGWDGIRRGSDGSAGWSGEQRLFQRVGQSWRSGILRYSGRLWLEERFRSGSEDLGLVLRLFGGASLAAVPGRPWWRLVVWDELFISAMETDWGLPQGLEHNRFFIGVAWAKQGAARIETGYLRIDDLNSERITHNAMMFATMVL